MQTYGCQMNYHDSERMLGMLEGMGYQAAENAEDADIVLINTCAVREKPERKLFAELGRLRKFKQRRPEMIIGVTGCMAPRDADIIRNQAPHVDLLIGPRSLHRLPDLVGKIERQRRPLEEIALDDDPTAVTPILRKSSISAWVDVMFGCNYGCTFCAVPTARGAELSRPPDQVFDEIDELQKLGFREVVLLGQTVNAYGRDFKYRLSTANGGVDGLRIDFSWLLREIDRRAPGMRLRFTSPHPQLFSDRLIRAVAELPAVCEHVHLPLQSANDEVLKRMQRAYTYSQYRSIVDKLRETIPGIAISTDIIVGFPGETEENFRETVQAFRDNGFDQAFMFAYSPRRHTKAFEYKDEIPGEIQKRRLQELIETANAQFNDKNRKLVGQTFEVLVEGPSEKNPDRLCGRTRTNKMVIFDGPKGIIGRSVLVKTEKPYLWGFEGTLALNENRRKASCNSKICNVYCSSNLPGN